MGKSKKTKSATHEVPAAAKKVSSAPPPKAVPSGKALLRILKTGSLYFIGIMAVTTILIVLDLHSSQRIQPRVYVGPIAVGYNTLAQAKAKLNLELTNYINTPISFLLGEKEVKITPQELGITFSAEEMVRNLPVIHFEKTNTLSLIGSLFIEENLSPLFWLDSDRAIEIIETKFDVRSKRAKDAHFIFDEKKKLQIKAETSGEAIAGKQLFEDLKSNLKNLKNGPIALSSMAENPQITAAQLATKQQQIESKLKKPVTFLFEGRKWNINLAEHLDAISLSENSYLQWENAGWKLPIIMNDQMVFSDETKVTVSTATILVTNEEKLQDYLKKELITKINRPTSDVKISKDQKGKITIEGKGHDGLAVAEPRLIASLDLALNSDAKRVQVPVFAEKSKVNVSEDLQTIGIKELVATGHSAFAGSHVGRIHNINTGITKYNGLLIKPGETFSFNQHLGPVDGQHGFKEELVIKAEGTVPEFGGGLCQVSSTLYRAALYAGFPIVERATHSYAVSYYAQVGGYGLDATIYPGSHDVRFINDSPAHILIQSYTEGDQAYFKFYGTGDGRQVSLEGPYLGNYRSPGATQIVETDKLAPGAKKQVEINHTGFDATWYRHLVKNGEKTKETIFSRYKAIPAKIMVGKSATAPAIET